MVDNWILLLLLAYGLHSVEVDAMLFTWSVQLPLTDGSSVLCFSCPHTSWMVIWHPVWLVYTSPDYLGLLYALDVLVGFFLTLVDLNQL
jgi:hypothetical protein